jgi:glucose/mannose-6-phosphate isomerase
MTGHDRMLAWVAALPDQLRAAATLPGIADVRPMADAPAHVVLCGMGGSAAAGGLLPLLWPGSPLPWTVHRDEGLPAWAGPRTLVIASSYSGETEETLAAVAEARRRGCALAALTSGGRLAALAREEGFPLLTLPGGQPPRTALGYSFASLLHLLHRLGLATDPAPGRAAAAAHLARGELVNCAGQICGAAAAADVAMALAGRFVVVYTSGAEAHAAGQRLKGQLNENAKAPASVAEFPELTHNDIVGWELPASRRDGFALVVLRGADENDRARQCADATIGLVAGQFASVTQVRGHGAAPLARVMGLIQFADLVSVAVAQRCGIDPIPIIRIDALKRAVHRSDEVRP